MWYHVDMIRLIVVLDNIRSTYNVGVILRAAEGFGAERGSFVGVGDVASEEQPYCCAL